MGKKKRIKRYTAQKAKKASKKTKSRGTYISIFLGILSLFLALIVINNTHHEVKFTGNNGKYTDPKTGISYLPADWSVYELRTEYLADKAYGRMDGEPVYKINGVSSKKWLIRKHESDLGYTLYYESSIVLPTVSDFKDGSILICTDGNIVSVDSKVENKDDVNAVISALSENSKVSKPENSVTSYNLRFVSEKYPFLYYCVKYIVTEDGGVFYLYDETVYIDAGTVLKNYIDSIGE